MKIGEIALQWETKGDQFVCIKNKTERFDFILEVASQAENSK